jgi:hypothetical protein
LLPTDAARHTGAAGAGRHRLVGDGQGGVDLRRDDLPDQVHVRARTLMCEVEVLVSCGTTVHLSGASVMGERKVEVEAGPVRSCT